MTSTSAGHATVEKMTDLDIARASKVLMVGAGGIGCELLKTLALSGFADVELIDLDTIDVSNLNRQFLFRRRHVGMSKAKVARESVLAFRPDAKITAHHDNVKDAAFDVDFVSRFDVCLNGLDNLDARRHVNRLCLAASVPLVESGTTGYLGQVTTHVKDQTACFECVAKPTPKSHPICTLRDTPDKPIHCVVFSTDLLFPRLFSADPNAKSDLDEDDAVELNAFTRLEKESPAAFAAKVFDYVFRRKIQTLLAKTEMWEKRTPPTPLASFAELAGGASPDDVAAGADASLIETAACKALGLNDANAVWSVADAARVFVSSAARILSRDAAVNGGTDAFSKDDALAVEFVTACALLRSSNYGIAPMSLFDAKGMAGNIVHAVATTNAIVGGLIVLEALKVLRNARVGKEIDADAATKISELGGPETPEHQAFIKQQRDQKCCAYKYTFVKQFASNNRLLEPIDADAPNPKCHVCGAARVELRCDATRMTLGSLIDDVLLKKIGMIAPEIQHPRTILYEHDDGDSLDEDEVETYRKNRSTRLVDLPAGGVKSGDVLSVTDFSQKFEFELLVTHVPREEWDDEEHPEGFELRGDASGGKGDDDDDADGGGGGGGGGDDDDDDDLCVVEDDDAVVVAGTAKRKRDDDDDDGDDDAGGGGKTIRSD